MPDGTGTGAKKETVYSGPALDNKQFAAGTVYQGPGQGAAQAQTPAVRTAPSVGSSRVHAAANWFYWIAGLSAVNSFLAFIHAPVRFIFGLGVTRMLDAQAQQGGDSAGIGVALVVGVVAAAVFAAFGYFANQAQKWAFVTGLLLYGLDALLLLTMLPITLFSLLFHAYALFAISRGLQYAQ
jgi:hypothetical protein